MKTDAANERTTASRREESIIKLLSNDSRGRCLLSVERHLARAAQALWTTAPSEAIRIESARFSACDKHVP